MSRDERTKRLKTSRAGAALLAFAAACLMGMIAPAPARAHHSFAMFDREHPVVITGTVREFQWTNPHVWIQLLVPAKAGADEEWGVECTSVNFMRRQGWDRTSLKSGDKVKITIYPLKDGSRGGQFGGMVELNGSPNNLPGYAR